MSIFDHISTSSSLNEKHFRQNCIESQNAHFMSNNIFFFLNRAFLEKIWENIAQPGRQQMTIRRMRIACWIPKATNTNSEYVIHIAFPWQQ